MTVQLLGTWRDLIDADTQTKLAKNTYVDTEFRDAIRLFLPGGRVSLIGDEFIGNGVTSNQVPEVKATIRKAIADAVEHLPAMNYLHTLA